MFSISIDFLCGQFRAASYYDRDEPEWPPHPCRLYSAAVACSAENGTLSDDADTLDWLAKLPPPKIYASDCNKRTVAESYVPVNDVTSTKSLDKYNKESAELAEILGIGEEIRNTPENDKRIKTIIAEYSKNLDINDIIKLLPEERLRQARTFPSVTLHDSCVEYIWDETIEDIRRKQLDIILARIVRLGRSSSFASVHVKTENLKEANYLPAESGTKDCSVRWVSSGQREALKDAYHYHQGITPRGSMPHISVNYRHLSDPEKTDIKPIYPNTSGEMLVFEFASSSRHLPISRTLEVASKMKATLMSYMNDITPSVSGHQSDGKILVSPHVSFLPLPWVGHSHADGRILGCSIVVPNTLPQDHKNMIYSALRKWEERNGMSLFLGRSGVIKMSRAISLPTSKTLRYATWRNSSNIWVSATPIALPFHPQGHFSKGTNAARQKAWGKAESAVIKSCEHIDIPPPAKIILGLSPFLSGSQHISSYPPFYQGHGKNKRARKLVHAVIEFDEPVSGNLVLGSGRFLGLGLMKPLFQKRSK